MDPAITYLSSHYQERIKSNREFNYLLSDIEELEDIVSKLLPTNTDENPDSIPNAGKTPKSKPEE